MLKMKTMSILGIYRVICFHNISVQKVILDTTANLKPIIEYIYTFDYIQILNFVEKNIPQAMLKDKQLEETICNVSKDELISLTFKELLKISLKKKKDQHSKEIHCCLPYNN